MESNDKMEIDLFEELQIKSQEEIQKEYLKALGDERISVFLLDRLIEGTKEELASNIHSICVSLSLEEDDKIRHDAVRCLAQRANKNEEIKSILEDISSHDIPRIAGTATGILDACTHLKSAAGFFK